VLLILSTFNVFFRDLQQLVAIVLQLLFYLTPIFYTRNSVPLHFRSLLFIDPMASIIEGYQQIFYVDALPSVKLTAYALAAAAVTFYVGRLIFNRYKDAFADYV